MRNTNNLQKVLILRLSSIGDVILTTPFLRCLKRVHPEVEIHFGVRREFAELLAYHPAIAHIIPIESSNGRNGLYKINHALTSERYDAVFDLHNNHRTRVLRNGLGARLHVVNKRSVRRFLLVRFNMQTMRTFLPVPEKYILTAKRYGVTPDKLGPEIVFPPELGNRIQLELYRLGMKQGAGCVGLCPGAKHFTKRWPQESFKQLAATILAQTDRQILILGGSDDAPFGAALGKLDRRVINMCGSLSLLETAAAMDGCTAVLTNDSGLMHLATARSIPVVALFGSTVREFGFFPYNSRSQVIEINGMTCRPCSHIGRSRCPKQHFRCMRDITVDRVWQSLSTFLETDRPG